MPHPRYKIILQLMDIPTYNIYFYYEVNGSVERSLQSMHTSLDDALSELDTLSKNVEIVLACSEESIYE